MPVYLLYLQFFLFSFFLVFVLWFWHGVGTVTHSVMAKKTVDDIWKKILFSQKILYGNDLPELSSPIFP